VAPDLLYRPIEAGSPFDLKTKNTKPTAYGKHANPATGQPPSETRRTVAPQARNVNSRIQTLPNIKKTTSKGGFFATNYTVAVL